MRGLRLFVRPIEPQDVAALDDFVNRNGSGGLRPAPAWGLLGKLLGDIVAVVSLDVTDDAVRIDDICVSRELRKKWIGRAMLREVEQLATKLERSRIIVEDARGAQEFFRRVGFESEGERWVRVLRA